VHTGFLKFEDYKGDIKYKRTEKWLKTTNYYKRDSAYILKQITTLDNKIFKDYLKKIKLMGLSGNEITISEIISQSNYEYYVIDFWANWCSPCILGVKLMNDMAFPERINVLSISVDKEEDKKKKKWTSKTQELK
jgi:thiol-disulfide isomerase/thioredoxin